MTKSILCFGDSITWGYNPKDGTRFAPEDRWPRALEAALQGRARVIEEGLNARTVATDDPARPFRNGLSMLPALLESHAPLDAVVTMLGTNDSAPCYGLTAGRIAISSMAMVRAILASQSGPDGTAPRMVLMAPPPLGSLNPEMALMYSGGQGTSRGLSAAYRTVANRFGIGFLDAGEIVRVSADDGVHLDTEDQRALGVAVGKVVDAML
ncbi:SGNH/GDSL hydrolase family protein [Methyloceanibacter sp.]|uniref:SGNH/GDSL hydrolase family protein n=1 Tax=Methyloceanibacter sp. TaxID=1965321 RepID=UPI002BF95F67|nr:SGNH/GDSL hydrolase family protein [Methyloceanibacter sp.]HML91036.1 SGNH/GDSL hydrolase family protein [Methyloceanibacter sp.]